MTDTLKINRFFSIFDWEKEESFLRRQHQKGWKLVKFTSPVRYTFEKCEPEDVIYQLDYNTETDKDNYVQLFTDCGWEYVQTFYGYSYFRKPLAKMDGQESIFSDNNSRVKMMKRVYRSRLGPICIMFCVLIVDLIACIALFDSPVLTGVCLALLILYLMLFCFSAVKYFLYKNRLEAQ